eukprot:COSAG05_NODE_829_length_7100_cov_62.147408_3_plen_382_part_00
MEATAADTGAALAAPAATEGDWYTSDAPGGGAGDPADLESGGSGGSSDPFGASPHSALVGSLASAAFGRVGAQGQDFATKYGRIDTFREYFDVETSEVARRLRASLWPYEKYGGVESDLAERCDLYGPTMCVLTLGCIVVYSMQLSHLKVKEGTVIGTSLALCFSYWFFTTALFYGAAKMCDTLLNLLNIASIVGYGFFGPCLGFTIGLLSPVEAIDNLAIFTAGLLSALAMGRMFWQRTLNPKKVMVGAFHLPLLPPSPPNLPPPVAFPPSRFCARRVTSAASICSALALESASFVRGLTPRVAACIRRWSGGCPLSVHDLPADLLYDATRTGNWSQLVAAQCGFLLELLACGDLIKCNSVLVIFMCTAELGSYTGPQSH